MVFLPDSWRNLLRSWSLFFVVYFASFLFPALIVLLGSMHLFSLYLRRVTAPTPPTIALLLSLRLLPRFSKLCLTPTSSNILNLTIFFLITSMAYRKARSTRDLLSYLTHTWSSSLRDFGESFVVALDISKAFDRVWNKALLAKLPAYGFTPSFCKLISSFFIQSLYICCCWRHNLCILPGLQWCSSGFCPFTYSVSSFYKLSSSCHCLWCSLLCRWFKPT